MFMMTNQELKNIFENNFYELFKYSSQYLGDLLDAEPVKFDIQFNTIKDALAYANEKECFILFNNYCAVRLAGNMFTYDIPIVPIKFGMYTSFNNTVVFKFKAYTVDDSFMSFSINLCQEEVEHLYTTAFNFLNKFTNMPNKNDFEIWWCNAITTANKKCFEYN
jgi:hypothetical protein